MAGCSAAREAARTAWPAPLTALLSLAVACVLPACRPPDASAPPTRVAATNSYLEYVLRDLLGGQEPVLRLAEAGMCPGHFDLRPSQAAQLGRCTLLLRFDFQSALGRKIGGICPALTIEPVRVPGGLCEPGTYLSACRQAADALVRAGLLDPQPTDQRLAEIDSRVQAAAQQARQRFRQVARPGTAVLASGHQSAFCRWLGLEVAATFRESDSGGVDELDQAVQAGRQRAVRLVVANRPEGRRAADALARTLGVRVAVLGNFPDAGQGHRHFEDLVRSNVECLIEAAQAPEAGSP